MAIACNVKLIHTLVCAFTCTVCIRALLGLDLGKLTASHVTVEYYAEELLRINVTLARDKIPVICWALAEACRDLFSKSVMG